MLRYQTHFAAGIAALLMLAQQPVAVCQPGLAPLNVTTKTTPSPGFMYLAPNSRVVPPPYQPYLGIYNANGGVVKVNRADAWPFEYKVLPDGRLGYSELIVFNGASAAAGIFIVDTTLTMVESLEQKRGYLATQHDFHMLPNGHRVILGAEDVTVDMSVIVPGGNPAATVVQAIIQELDVDGNVLMQWRSLDHIPVTDSYEDLTAASIRYIHNNSLWIDDDGNWLVSMRHASCIVKVNRTTGEIMWKLGGKHNEFTFIGDHEENAPTYFSYQHDIRRIANGHITMFDNGTQHTPQASRAVEYEIDEVNKTCRMVWEYRHTPDIFVGLQGGVQTLPDGHRLIGWGSAANEGSPGVTEVDSTGTVVFEAYYPKQMFVYRATKHPFWPPGKPSATITVKDVLKDDTYRYAKDGQDVGIKVTFTSLQSSFYNTTTARRFMWSPVNPRWAVEAPTARQVRVDITTDGIQQHQMDIRFQVDTLGLGVHAEHMVVYRRDTADSGTFVALPTRYDAGTRELVVTGTTHGEFAFGIPTELPEGVPGTPLLQWPVHGERILELARHNLRMIPMGRTDVLHVQVAEDMDFDNIVYDNVTPDDFAGYNAPAAERTYYWRAMANTFVMNSEWSAVDSFVVAPAYITVERPSTDTTWQYDNSYIVSWRTNAQKFVRLELVRDFAAPVLIRDSVKATATGFLWKIPVSVPVGTGYRVRATVLDSAFNGMYADGSQTITIGDITSVEDTPNTTDLISDIRRIRVFGLTGEQVMDRTYNGNGSVTEPYLQTLPSGVWWMAIEDADGRTHIQKLVIQH